ncbi:hypothetical protein ACJJIU_10365 [Microbulbifer sp. CnH-101-E]|uniref:hypothetical protein n=1 Tax=unclassified Microbulbifer TaxID=2619833 RepID=UPI00403A43D1
MKEYIKKAGIDLTNIQVSPCPGDWLGLGHEFDLSAKEFLSYAKDDLSTGTPKGYANAITNSKRAIDCQTDWFVKSIGLDHAGSFPAHVKQFVEQYSISVDANKNLRVIEALGVAPSGLISKYRKIRNQLEHHYQTPQIPDVKEAVEVAELFVRAVDNSMRSMSLPVLSNIDAKAKGKGQLSIYFASPGFIEIKVYPKIGGDPEYFKITQEDAFFMRLIKICLSIGAEIDWKKSIIEFVQAIVSKVPEANIKVVMSYG